MAPSTRSRSPSVPSSPLSSLPPSLGPSSSALPPAEPVTAVLSAAEPSAPKVKKFGSLQNWLKFKRADEQEKQGLYTIVPKPPMAPSPQRAPSPPRAPSPTAEPIASSQTSSLSRAVLLGNGMVVRAPHGSDARDAAIKRVLDAVAGPNRQANLGERVALGANMEGEQSARFRAQEEEMAAMRRALARQEKELAAARKALKRQRREGGRRASADAEVSGEECDSARDDVRPPKALRASTTADAASTASGAPSTPARSISPSDVDPDEVDPDEVDIAEEQRGRLILAVKQEMAEGIELPPMWVADDEAALTAGDREAADIEMSFERVEEPERTAQTRAMEKGKGRADASYKPPVEDRFWNDIKEVPYTMYQSSKASKEAQNLRAILHHVREPISMPSRPCVADPVRILEEGGISPSVFQDAQPLGDAALVYRIIGFTTSTNYVVGSPNAAYLPHVPDPDVPQRIRMRRDCRFGAEDVTLVPTYYMPNFAGHLACIPARPPSSAHPSQILYSPPDLMLAKIYDRLSDEQDAFVLTDVAHEQLHRLIVPLRKKANKYIDFCKRHSATPIVWARGLEIALAHIFARLAQIPSPRTRAQLMVRELQRLSLELMGMMNFVFEVQPILTGLVDPPEVQPVRYYLGAITCDPAEVQALHRAGVPVWHVMPYDGSLRRRLRDPDLTLVPHADALVKMYAPEEMAETGRHPDNLPYIFEGLPTHFDRLRQIHRYSTQCIAVHSSYRDDMAPETGRDPYAYRGTSIRVYGASHLRPLEELLAGGDKSKEQRRPRWPIDGIDPTDELPAAPSGTSDPSDQLVDLPAVDLDQSDVIYEADPPAPEAFILAEEDADGGAGLGDAAASPTEPSAGAATSTSTSTSADPQAFTALAPSISSSTSTSGTPAASTSASPAPSLTPPIAKRIEGQALWRPIGVHDPRRKGKQNSTGVLTRNHKSDLPTMPPIWSRWCSKVCDNWRHDGAMPGDSFRTFPLPTALVGPNSDAKIARFVQVWLALEDGAIQNARRNPRDPDAFRQHSMGMTWVQPEDGTVADRKDFVQLPQAARTPAVQEEPCLAVSAQVWKDVLNAHTTFRAQGATRQAAIMGPVRDIFGQTFNFSAILGKLSQPYLVLGETVKPGQLPCPRTMKGLLWRLHELVFRKDLMDLERRLRVLLLTPAEEHQRLRHVFHRETYGADILTVVGSGEVDRGLVAEGWVERYPYVFALGALMLDWAEPLPERVREALQAPKMSERQFLWLEGKIVEHYVTMLFAYFQRKAIGPACRSTEF